MTYKQSFFPMSKELGKTGFPVLLFPRRWQVSSGGTGESAPLA
jgi:hypothetical protein